MLTLLEIIKRTTDFFAGKGIESPRLNAELLIGHALGLKRMQLYVQFERPLAEAELEKIRPLVRRRGMHEPLQYITGEMEFFGLRLKVDKRALIPRPETELLVEIVVSRFANSAPPACIVDLGTGSGAMALALAKQWPEAKVTALDANEEALALARENATTLELLEHVTLLRSNWFAQISAEETFDLIVSNPPYLTAQETAETLPEVRNFEPLTALTSGGPTGTGDLKLILNESAARLNGGGLLALETGIAQHAELVEYARGCGFVQIESRQDLTKRDRYILATK